MNKPDISTIYGNIKGYDNLGRSLTLRFSTLRTADFYKSNYMAPYNSDLHLQNWGEDIQKQGFDKLTRIYFKNGSSIVLYIGKAVKYTKSKGGISVDGKYLPCSISALDSQGDILRTSAFNISDGGFPDEICLNVQKVTATLYFDKEQNKFWFGVLARKDQIEIGAMDYITYNTYMRELDITYEQFIQWFGDEDALTPFTYEPYIEGGTSDEGGGTMGTWDDTPDIIDEPSDPDFFSSATGFTTLYNPTLNELQSLGSYLWAGFDIENWKKLFSHPIDSIIGCWVLPCSVSVAGKQNVKLGNVSTNVSMNVVNNNFVNLDCGTLKVDYYSDSYLDFEPYTRYEIYLPYVGIRTLDADIITGKTLHLKYKIDVSNGGFVATISVDGNVYYQFAGCCSSQLPITSSNWDNLAGSLTNMTTNMLVGGVSGGGSGLVLSALSSSANAIMNSKPRIENTGNIGSSTGFMGVQTPYLIIHRPKQCLPEKQKIYTGYPSYITSKVGSLSGYTEFEHIHLDGIICTDDERSEIERILKSGVIL